MSKVTKTELREAVDAHSQSITSATCAANASEKARELEWVKRTGSALIDILERPMRATVDQQLIDMAERLVDRSAKMIGDFEFGQVKPERVKPTLRLV